MAKSSVRRQAMLASALFAFSAVSFTVTATELMVSAAASLRNAFTEIGSAFEKHYPDTKVVNSFAASDVLLQQIVNGAPVDVFASADQKAMDKAQDAKTILPTTRHDFVQNSLVLIVPKDNPKKITDVIDLNSAEVTRVAFGNPDSVPAGRYTQAALEKVGQWGIIEQRKIVGQNVRQVLEYVSRGEVDAGFVFATDAAMMKDRVNVIKIIETVTPVTYPIAVVKRDKANTKAQAYIDFVLSDEGQEVLAKHGFTKASVLDASLQ